MKKWKRNLVWFLVTFCIFSVSLGIYFYNLSKAQQKELYWFSKQLTEVQAESFLYRLSAAVKHVLLYESFLDRLGMAKELLDEEALRAYVERITQMQEYLESIIRETRALSDEDDSSENVKRLIEIQEELVKKGKEIEILFSLKKYKYKEV